MYAPPSPQPPTAAPRIGEWFSESFNLFGREWVTWVLQGLVYLLLASIPIIPGFIAYIGMIFRAAAAGGEPGLDVILPAMGALYGGSCLSGVVGLYLLCGMSRTAMKQLRGEPISVGDIFSGGDVFLPMLGAYILVVLGVYLGLIFCIVPGLVLMGLWVFVHPLIVEGRMGVFEALGRSWETTKPYLRAYVGWALIIALVYGVGGSTGCGVVATMPIAILMMMVSYRDVFEQPAAFTAVPQGPATPPVYYGPAGAPTVGGNCPSCGRVVAAGAVVCPSCGAQLPGGSGLSTPPGA